MCKRVVLSAIALAMLWCSYFACAQEGAALPEGAAIVQENPQPVKNPVAQLRGKLLYKRNQAKRLERAASEADAELKKKVEALESQIKALYVEANPKLAEIYAEQKQLDERIEALNQN